MPTGAEPSRGGHSRPGGDPRHWDLAAAAPAKLNLGLELVRRRADGFHDIRTIFQAVDLEDRLRFRDRSDGEVQLEILGGEGLPVDEGNLVVRAARLLARRRAPGRGAAIELRKRIPWGAGLGGGSSDAAATLLALERLWGLDPDPAELAALALELGSDVPFFLLGGTALGEGRGELLTPVPEPPECLWVLFLPPWGISTAEAYRLANKDLTIQARRIILAEQALQRGAYRDFVENLVNDLEPGAFRLQPRLETFRNSIRDLGPDLVLMTGSGSALFAMTREGKTAERLIRPDSFRAGSEQDRGAGFDAERLMIHPVRTGARLLPQTTW